MHIKSIQISTVSLAATERFYSDTLGLSLVFKSTDELHYQVGSSVLKFKRVLDKPAIYHYAFNLPPHLLESAISWATKQLQLITNPEEQIISRFENWNANAIYFYDNNGNLVEFIARYDLAVAPDNLIFHPSKLQSISEIGIVDEHPIALASKWIKAHELPYFEKSPPTADFLAMGDDNGLLIVVSPQRKWFPTNLIAQKTETVIELENRGKYVELIIERS